MKNMGIGIMTWIDIGALDADRRDWQLSQPITSNLIKIINDVSQIPSQTSNYRGLIGINYEFQDFFEIKEFFSIPKSQIFLFTNLNLERQRYLAVRNLTFKSSRAQWTIRAYAWDQFINTIYE